jgi:hypothetical protein
MPGVDDAYWQSTILTYIDNHYDSLLPVLIVDLT